MRKTYPLALIALGVVLFVLSITSLVALASKVPALASIDDWSSIGKQVLTISVLGGLSYFSLKAARRRW